MKRFPFGVFPFVLVLVFVVMTVPVLADGYVAGRNGATIYPDPACDLRQNGWKAWLAPEYCGSTNGGDRGIYLSPRTTISLGSGRNGSYAQITSPASYYGWWVLTSELEWRTTPTPTPVSVCRPGSGYVVDWWDTWEQIASKCGVTTAALKAANPSQARYSAPATFSALTIPLASYTPSQGNAQILQNGCTHTVGSGETLGGLASKYGKTIAELMRFNGNTNPNLIYAGQRLNVCR